MTMMKKIYHCLLQEFGLSVDSSNIAILRAVRSNMGNSPHWIGRKNRNWRHAMMRSTIAAHELNQRY